MKKWMIAFAGVLLLMAGMLAVVATASEISGRNSDSPPTESAILTDGSAASNRMSVESRRTDTGYAFDLALTGSMRGQILGVLYGRDGQLLLTQADNASSHCEFTFEDEETAGYAKFMWIDENHKPLCESVRTDLPAVAAYSKPLDEEHIAEVELSYEGETVSTLYVDNEILLDVKDGVTKEQIERLVGEYSGAVVGEIPMIGQYQIELRNASGLNDLNGVLSALSDSPLLESASPNPVMELDFNSDIFTPYYPTDPWEGASWNEGYPSDKNWGLEAINAPSAWRMLMNRYQVTDDEAANGDFSKIPKANIGIIDSMFDTEHPDLRFDHVYEVRDNVDSPPRKVRDLALRETVEDKYKNYSHGTHVAGTIAAIHDRKGISGVSLSHTLSVVSVLRDAYVEDKFTLSGKSYFTLNDFQSELSALICGNPIENAPRKVVINFSMGNGDWHPIIKANLTHDLKDYVQKGYDFLIVASAGNGSDNDAAKNSVFTAIDDPDVTSRIIVVGAAYKHPNDEIYILSSEENENHQIVSYNYGDRIDVAAPGGDILSAVPPSGYFGAKEYHVKTGTSMAAPHVTGTAALIWEANPNLTGQDVKNILINTADIELSNVEDTGRRHGRVINNQEPVDNGKMYPRYMINAAHAVSEALARDYLIQGQCGESLSWHFNRKTHTLTVSGKGKMTDFQESEVPWHRYRNEIETVNIGDGITSIGTRAFCCFENLSQVSLSQTLTEIGAMAFASCNKLSAIPRLPASLTNVGGNAFPEHLESVTFTGASPSIVAQGTNYDDEKQETWPSFYDNTTIYYPGHNEDWQKAVQDNGDGTHTWNGYRAVPYGIATLSGVVWEKGLTAPISGVTVDCAGPSAVQHTSAADGSFKFENLKEGTYTVTFRKSGYQDVTRTLKLESGKDVLWNAIQMERAQSEKCTLRGTVTARESGAAVSGASLVVYKGRLITVTAPVQENGSFSISLMPGDYTIEVWCDGYEKYQESVTITNSERTLTIPLTKVQSSEPWMEWEFDEATGTLTITGSGSMPEYNYSFNTGVAYYTDVPWYEYRNSIQSVHIESGITSIGSFAFYGCSNLVNLTMPYGITRIGAEAFYHSSLTNISMPDSVTHIGSYAFSSCNSLTHISLSSNLISIDVGLLYQCGNLTSIEIPDGVDSIGTYAFLNCARLAKVTIPDSVTNIGIQAFYACSSLTSVTIPDSVINIGYSAFEGCTSLSSVTISDNITSIGSTAFGKCTSLTSVTIPNSVTSMYSAFYGCVNLKSIIYKGTEQQWALVSKGRLPAEATVYFQP